jgi:MFS transporter, FHS family, glucose/mannose:H+ symporter
MMHLQSLFAPGPRRILLVAGSLGMFVMGVSQALYGPFFPHFAATLGVTSSRLGLLPGLHFAAATVGVVGGGFVARRWGYRRLLRGGAALLAGGYFTAATAGSWIALLAGVGMIGLGFGILVNFNILVDGVFGVMGPAALQLINAFFSVGAILAPLLAVLSLRLGGQVLAFSAGGIVAVVLVGLLVAADRGEGGGSSTKASPSATPDDAPDGAGRAETVGSVAAGRAEEAGRAGGAGLLLPVAVFLPLFLIFPGAEASYASWMPTHLFSLLALGTASAVTSGFWIMYTLGRLLAVPLSARIPPGALVIGAMIVAAVATIAATVDALAASAYLVAGLALGPVFPGSLSWLKRRYPARVGEVSSIVIGAGGVGGMILPPVIGVIVEHRGPGIVPVALAAVLVVAVGITVAIGIGGRSGRTPAADGADVAEV